MDTWKHLQKDVNGYFFVDITQRFAKQGIQIVHIWEDVWRVRTKLVEARIGVLLGRFVRYHARQMEVHNINSDMLKTFLKQHHLNVVVCGRYKYGLFLRGEMMAAATFSNSCPIDRNGKIYQSYELIRYASKIGIVAVGGLGKLITHFIRDKNPDDIMTYVDMDWGSGVGLLQLGFQCVELRPPQMFWLDSSGNRCYSEVHNSDIVCWNSGSYKFLRLIK
jgi:hypothetical protein